MTRKASSQQDVSVKLADLSIDQARRQKWAAGRAKYGPIFVGHPLEQLDAELLDAMNYTDEAVRQGYAMGTIGARLRELCEEARGILRGEAARGQGSL